MLIFVRGQSSYTWLSSHTLAPFAPTIVSIEATSSTSISVQWNAGEKDGGSPTTGYVVEYHAASDPSSSFETQVVARDVFSTTLDGLTPSTEYEVRVRGENAVGRSVPSATMRTKTDRELIEKSYWELQMQRLHNKIGNLEATVQEICFITVEESEERVESIHKLSFTGDSEEDGTSSVGLKTDGELIVISYYHVMKHYRKNWWC